MDWTIRLTRTAEKAYRSKAKVPVAAYFLEVKCDVNIMNSELQPQYTLFILLYIYDSVKQQQQKNLNLESSTWYICTCGSQLNAFWSLAQYVR